MHHVPEGRDTTEQRPAAQHPLGARVPVICPRRAGKSARSNTTQSQVDSTSPRRPQQRLSAALTQWVRHQGQEDRTQMQVKEAPLDHGASLITVRVLSVPRAPRTLRHMLLRSWADSASYPHLRGEVLVITIRQKRCPMIQGLAPHGPIGSQTSSLHLPRTIF